MKNKNSNKDRKVTEKVEVAYTYLIKNPASNELMVCAWDSPLYPGTHVIIPTRYGLDLGIILGDASKIGKNKCESHCCDVCGAIPEDPDADPQPLLAAGDYVNGEIVYSMQKDMDCSEYQSQKKAPVQCEIDGDIEFISRLATPSDMEKYKDLTKDEDDAMRICREKILKHKLDMKLVTAHFLVGEPKVLFFFTADVRVDFRELVKDLVSVFRMRIELRQIGVRDESRVLGGLAVCGRDFCCHCVTDKLNPVSIKMAKEQNLSLNSMKISGPCGRLLCCLSYEYDFYVEEKKAYPPEGTRIKINHELWKVGEVNILSHTVTLFGTEGRMLVLPGNEITLNDETGFWTVNPSYLDEIMLN